MPAYGYDDPDASGCLLAPAKRKRHQVRIQGRLVLVRSVSAVNLAPSTQQTNTPAVPPLPAPGLHHDPGVGSVVKRRTRTSARRPSYTAPATASTSDGFVFDFPEDVPAVDTASETEEDEHETAVRDQQRRGYGIGGAGNIRRPTEVVQFYSTAGSTSGRDDSGRRRRWQWMSSLLGGLRGKKEESDAARPAGPAAREGEEGGEMGRR